MSLNNEILLSIIMPCLNEERTLGKCIQDAHKFITDTKISAEIVVVDNGSTDNSANIARQHGARVVFEPKRGYGSALIAGIRETKGKFAIMGDCDNSLDWSDLYQFIEKLNEGYDVVIGNRFAGGIAKGAMPFLHKYIGNPGLTFVAATLFGLKAGDIQCGFRGFDRKKVDQLQLKCTGMEFATEMMAISALSNFSITEIPVKLRPDGRERPPHLRTWSDGWKHIKTMISLSPRWFLVYPGYVLLSIGMLLCILTFSGPIHFTQELSAERGLFVVGCLMFVLGTQTSIIGMILERAFLGQERFKSVAYSSMLKKYLDTDKFFIASALSIISGIVISWSAFSVMREYEFVLADFGFSFKYLIIGVSLVLFGLQLLIDAFVNEFLKYNYDPRS